MRGFCRPFVNGIAALSLVAFFGCRHGVRINAHFDSKSETRDTFHKSFLADHVNSILVKTESGDIKVKADPTAKEISIQAEKVISGSGSATSLASDLPLVKPAARLESGTLIVETAYNGLKPGRQARVNFLIVVPQGMAVKLQSGSGDTSVEGISAAVDVRTGSGAIHFAGLSGDAAANSGSGDIQVDGLVGAKSVELNSNSGSVRGENNSAEHLVVNASSGDIELRGDFVRSELHSSSGDISLHTTGSRLTELEVTTSSGSIETNLNGSIGGHLVAATSSGSITVELPNAPAPDDERRDLSLDLPGVTQAQIRLKSNSGDIEVRKE